MSYSVSNIDSLRSLYCFASRETNENWQEFHDQLEVDFNGTMDEAIKTKCEAYFSNLLENITSIFDKSHWRQHNIVEGEMLFTNLYSWKDNNLAPAITSLVSHLTHSFRHELLRLSELGCSELAADHVLIIKDCLKRKGNLEEIVNQELIPDPKEQINSRIRAYIIERKKRWFKSNNTARESFLRNFQVDLNFGNPDLKVLIDRISQQVFFKNDWPDWIMRIESEGSTLSQMDESLNYLNPFIQSLEIYQQGQPTPTVDETRCTFNNPFITALFHNSLNQTLEDVLLLLMRLHITNNNASINTRSATIISQISNKYSRSFNTTIADHITKLRQLASAREREEEQEHRNSEMMPQSGA